jgi:hypothetical protein
VAAGAALLGVLAVVFSLGTDQHTPAAAGYWIASIAAFVATAVAATAAANPAARAGSG